MWTWCAKYRFELMVGVVILLTCSLVVGDLIHARTVTQQDQTIAAYAKLSADHIWTICNLVRRLKDLGVDDPSLPSCADLLKALPR